MSEDQEIVVQISTQLTEADRTAIRAFKARITELRKTRLASGDRFQVNASVKLAEGMPPSFEVTLPPEDDLRSFLMAFRFFWADKEPTNCGRIANIVKRAARQPEVQNFIEN